MNRTSFVAMATSFKTIGFLMIFSGVLLNEWSLVEMFAHYGDMWDPRRLWFIRVGQGCLLLAGLWLLLRRPGHHWPLMTRGLLILVFTTTTVFGAYVTGLRQGWIQPWVMDLPEVCERLYTGDAAMTGVANIEHYSVELAKVESKPGEERKTVKLQQRLADHLLRHGRVAEAIEHLESAYALAISRNQPSNVVNKLRYRLAVSHLRDGEISNCIDSHDPAGCFFPIPDGDGPNPRERLRLSSISMSIFASNQAILGCGGFSTSHTWPPEAIPTGFRQKY